MNNFKVCFLALALFLPISIFSQSEEDYKKTLDFISTAFNEKNASSIYQNFSAPLKQAFNKDLLKKELDSLYLEKGKISSYEFIMQDENEKSYLIDFEDSSMLLLLYLSSDKQISKFEIKEY